MNEIMRDDLIKAKQIVNELMPFFPVLLTEIHEKKLQNLGQDLFEELKKLQTRLKKY